MSIYLLFYFFIFIIKHFFFIYFFFFTLKNYIFLFSNFHYFEKFRVNFYSWHFSLKLIETKITPKNHKWSKVKTHFRLSDFAQNLISSSHNINNEISKVWLWSVKAFESYRAPIQGSMDTDTRTPKKIISKPFFSTF